MRITGLGRVPNTDDPFYVVNELTKAQEIAEAREQKEQDAAARRVLFGRTKNEKTREEKQKSADIRKLGGALYGDRRYNRVFIGHNGADSYYSGRGFRGWLKI